VFYYVHVGVKAANVNITTILGSDIHPETRDKLLSPVSSGKKCDLLRPGQAPNIMFGCLQQVLQLGIGTGDRQLSKTRAHTEPVVRLIASGSRPKCDQRLPGSLCLWIDLAAVDHRPVAGM
jgi:hypothetical protein